MIGYWLRNSTLATDPSKISSLSADCKSSVEVKLKWALYDNNFLMCSASEAFAPVKVTLI